MNTEAAPADRPEIIDDTALVAAWLKPEDGKSDEPWKARTNYASKIGHPCDRYLTLVRTHGDKAAPPSPRLKAIFKRGRVLESVAVRQLEALGWKTWDHQRKFDLIEKGEVILACKIDCITRSPEGAKLTYVVDHKVVNPHDWEKIPRGWDGYDYLRNAEKPWLRAWPAQAESYMYVQPGVADVGILQLLNAETLLPKTVYIPFEVDYMQEIIDRATSINARVKAVLLKGMSELPPPIDWDEAICGRCELLGVCLPDQLGRTPLELIDDDSFLELVERDRELNARIKLLERQYDTVHGQIRHMIGTRRQVGAGSWLITQKEVHAKAYSVPAKVYDRMDIKSLGPKEQTETVAESA